MTQPPEDLTQPIPADATHEQAAVDAGAPAGGPATPAWAHAAHEGEGAASGRPVPVAGTSPAPPVVPTTAAAAAASPSWRSRVGGGRGVAVGALVVGLGLGAVGGSAATWALTHDDRGSGTTADRNGPVDRDGDGGFGPTGGRGGPPPGDQLPGGQLPGGQLPGGQLPGGDQQQDGTDANDTSLAT